MDPRSVFTGSDLSHPPSFQCAKLERVAALRRLFDLATSSADFGQFDDVEDGGVVAADGKKILFADFAP